MRVARFGLRDKESINCGDRSKIDIIRVIRARKRQIDLVEISELMTIQWSIVETVQFIQRQFPWSIVEITPI